MLVCVCARMTLGISFVLVYARYINIAVFCIVLLFAGRDGVRLLVAGFDTKQTDINTNC